MRKPPAAFDIVWCRFPTREHPEHPGPKERPAMILGATTDGAFVAASYGGSQAHGLLKPWQLPFEAQKGTLTLFDLSRVAKLPWITAYFPAKPRLSVLPDSKLTELKACVTAAKSAR